MRYSQQRENIKKGLEKFCIHPSAEQLYAKLKPENPTLSLATVYRNLNYLATKGVIKRIDGLSEQVHYDHNTIEHYHIICQNCGKIMDLPPEMAEGFKKVLNNQTDFEITSYDILVKGICYECRSLRKGDKKW